MVIVLTERFRRAYRSLTTEDQKRVQNPLRRMSEDLRHPGLRVKRIRGTHGIWEARASRALRLTFEVEGDKIVLRNVGSHDATLKKP
jgi:mRNA-degrading endonuclease RelE of RelBE toxin-antitoxin system